MRTGVRRLGITVAWTPPPHLEALARHLRRWCLPMAADVRADSPDAWLLTDAGLLERAPFDAVAAPIAIWVSDASGLERARAARPALLLSHSRALAREAADVLFVPGTALAAAATPPFVRQALRRRAGLPDPMVLDVRADAAGRPGPGVILSALAVCSAAVAGPDLLMPALARGTPTVTDVEAAAAVGAVDGRDVLVSPPDAAPAAASALARDPERCAVLSHGARRLAGAEHDLDATALRVVMRLDLIGRASWRDRVDPRLAELHTPGRAGIRLRVAQVMTSLMRTA